MNVELTIQDMFDNYPGIFKERSDCLNHLFCVIGNGYDWYKGELVSVCEETDPPAKLIANLVDGKAFQHNKLSLREESIYYAKQRFYRTHSKDEEFVIDKYSQQYYDSIPDVQGKRDGHF